MLNLLYLLSVCYFSNTESAFAFRSDEFVRDSIVLPEDCSKIYQYSIKERMSRYPFSKADQVMLISWKEPEIKAMPKDSLVLPEEVRLYQPTPIKNNRLDYPKISETATLNANQTDKLTSILYEYDGIAYAPMPCYSPHHAVVFLKNEEVLEFIEICFQCRAVRVSHPEEMGIKTTFCTEKYEMLRSFFQDAGIYGGFGKG
ncbi:MAG: hypothetical protein JNN28_00500 [Saprospiraceae bacterium]|nr:hypothetical protein [Saprospiraceae bacterium]